MKTAKEILDEKLKDGRISCNAGKYTLMEYILIEAMEEYAKQQVSVSCRSNISIEAEFLAGTDVHGAIQEARELAQKLGVAYIKFKFNDRKLSIGQTADLNYCYNQFDKGEKFIVSA